MAHKFRVKAVPHVNVDGKRSKTKKDWQVWDRTRGGRRLVGVCGSKSAAVDLIAEERMRLIAEHREKHPNDELFRKLTPDQRTALGEAVASGG